MGHPIDYRRCTWRRPTAGGGGRGGTANRPRTSQHARIRRTGPANATVHPIPGHEPGPSSHNRPIHWRRPLAGPEPARREFHGEPEVRATTGTKALFERPGAREPDRRQPTRGCRRAHPTGRGTCPAESPPRPAPHPDTPAELGSCDSGPAWAGRSGRVGPGSGRPDAGGPVGYLRLVSTARPPRFRLLSSYRYRCRASRGRGKEHRLAASTLPAAGPGQLTATVSGDLPPAASPTGAPARNASRKSGRRAVPADRGNWWRAPPLRRGSGCVSLIFTLRKPQSNAAGTRPDRPAGPVSIGHGTDLPREYGMGEADAARTTTTVFRAARIARTFRAARSAPHLQRGIFRAQARRRRPGTPSATKHRYRKTP